jgi:hypothetical protein
VKTATDPHVQVLQAVIRSERPLTDLRSVGLVFHCDETSEVTKCWVENPQQLSITVDIADLAAGLLAHHDDPLALRAWALFVITADIDFDADRDPAGETVLETLRDASFGGPIEPAVIATLQQLVAGNGSRG